MTEATIRFDKLSDPAVGLHFREAIASGPITARPLPKLVERLAKHPWAAHVAVTVARSSFVLGREDGPRVRVVFWQHIQTFQVWSRAPGAEEVVVGQGTHAGLVEKLVVEAAQKLLS